MGEGGEWPQHGEEYLGQMRDDVVVGWPGWGGGGVLERGYRRGL